MSGTFFSDCAFLFFTFWSVGLGSLTLVTFGRDLLSLNSESHPHSASAANSEIRSPQ